jgi:hypothetical protein
VDPLRGKSDDFDLLSNLEPKISLSDATIKSLLQRISRVVTFYISLFESRKNVGEAGLTRLR